MTKKRVDEAKPKMKQKQYEKELHKLQVELCRLRSGKQEGLRASSSSRAGTRRQGGTIKAITERVSRASSGWSRCRPHPTARRRKCTLSGTCRSFRCGEVVIFDRSWYNRAGVER